MASSLVGDNTNTVGPIWELLRVRLRCINPGSKYPKVFPDPVLAMATMSLLWRATGHDWAWIGVGAEKPAFCTWKKQNSSSSYQQRYRPQHFRFFFFGLIEELNGRRSNPHIRRPKLASASWSRRRPLLSFGQSGRLNHHQQQSRPQTWVIRKALHKNWSTVKGRSKLNASAHKRAAQRTTLAPPRSKYRTCDKKYRWQNN